MKRRKTMPNVRPAPGHLAAILKAAGSIKPGTVGILTVGHDAGCPLLGGSGACTCQRVDLALTANGQRVELDEDGNVTTEDRLQ